MKQLMVDHFRRWSWVLGVVTVAEFALGGLIALGPQYIFEFWALMLSMWSGATLIAFDFRKGMLRAVAVSPMTARQMGRSWWFATVPIPATALAALLFSGAGTYCYFNPGHAFPTQRLVMGSLFTLVWLGIQFTLVFNGARGFGRNGREFIGNSLISALTMLTYFGSMVLCHNASTSPLKSAVLLGVGAFLTAVGWVRAERFDLGRAGLFLGRIEPPYLQPGGLRQRPQTLKAPDDDRVPGGYGGMRFLLSTVSVRSFLQIGALLALMALLLRLQGQKLSPPASLQLLATTGTFMSCWFVMIFQFIPILSHLRVLRTLSISATGLAGVMLALVLVPLSAMGSLAAAVAWLAWGPLAALAALNSCAFALGGVALCVFFAVWLGVGMRAYALLLFSLMGFLLGHLWLQTHFHYLERPLSFAGPIAAVCVLLAFVLTRQALIRGRHVYRVPATAFGGFPLGTTG